MQDDDFKITAACINSATEHAQLAKIYQDGFTPWYPPLLPRLMINALARALPECMLQIHLPGQDQPAGYIFALPIHWNGNPEQLETFDHYTVERFQGHRWGELKLAALMSSAALLPAGFPFMERRMRSLLLDKANALMLMAMIIKPAWRKHNLAAKFLAHLKQTVGKDMGLGCIVAPFRPSDFGRYKQAHGLSLSQHIFDEYCTARDAEGRLVDSWLRSVERSGVQFLRTEIRSIKVTKSLREFESFRRSYKAGDWHELNTGVWECGEVPTFYTDPNLGKAFSLEPNIWGRISLDNSTATHAPA